MPVQAPWGRFEAILPGWYIERIIRHNDQDTAEDLLRKHVEAFNQVVPDEEKDSFVKYLKGKELEGLSIFFYIFIRMGPMSVIRLFRIFTQLAQLAFSGMIGEPPSNGRISIFIEPYNYAFAIESLLMSNGFFFDHLSISDLGRLQNEGRSYFGNIRIEYTQGSIALDATRYLAQQKK